MIVPVISFARLKLHGFFKQKWLILFTTVNNIVAFMKRALRFQCILLICIEPVAGVDIYFVDPVKVQVLKQVNIEVNKGEFVSIMGKSGCGKSTLLYILSTMDTAYEGNLFLGDRLLTGLNGAALSEVRNQHIGFVFQFHYLLPEFTLQQKVMMPGLKLSKKSKD